MAPAAAPSASTDQTSWIDWFQNSSVQNSSDPDSDAPMNIDRCATRGVVDPVRRCRQSRALALGRCDRLVRRGDLARQVPADDRQTEHRRCDGDDAGGAKPQQGGQRDTAGEDREQQPPQVGVRERPRLIQPLQDREPERVRVEVLVGVVGRRPEQPAHGSRCERERDRPDDVARPASARPRRTRSG